MRLLTCRAQSVLTVVGAPCRRLALAGITVAPSHIRALRSLHNGVKRTPLDDITRLRELINRSNATNSKLDKESILAEYADLRPLLSFLLSPYCRLHITASSLHKYIKQRSDDEEWQTDTKAACLRHQQEQQAAQSIPSSMLELFQRLASREITGGRALSTVKVFLDRHGIMQQHSNSTVSELSKTDMVSPAALDIFTRCLDRNLKAGFNDRMLRTAFSDADIDHAKPRDVTGSSRQTSEIDSANVGDLDFSQVFKGSFEAALGKSLSRDEVPSLLGVKDQPKWLASRKLDGVRCFLAIQTRLALNNGQLDLQVDWVQPLSRSGRPFTTLSVLKDELIRVLPSCEAVKSLLASNLPLKEGSAPISTRFVLDGEVCVLSPSQEVTERASAALDPETENFEHAAGQKTDLFVEDFPATVSLVRRKDYTIANPAYFPFDLLTFDEFTNWRTEPSRPFSDRLKAVDALASHFQRESTAVDGKGVIRRLKQESVHSADDVNKMLDTASRHGWEGLILRQDVPYQGKRTPAIRKLKQWNDAEYTVDGITISTMRLPISGTYQERKALAAVQITHKGTSVSVGSGFTPEQRVLFAEDPTKIMGMTVTVQYFEESSARSDLKSSSQDPGNASPPTNWSLRFPVIKQIWGEKRDI